jgi:hypothetical protein
MSTRIGKYIFDVDLENMGIEELSMLKEGCEHFIKEKHREEIHRELTKINLLASTYGFDICVLDSFDFPQVMNEYTLRVEDHDRITELYDEQ